MDHPLVDFINHGVLPFTGREPEAARIIAHWEKSGDAHGLGAVLLSGEAGVGKSRLIEEVSARIARLGGAVVHAKLYPESPTAIVPLLARAVSRFAAANALLKVEPEENLPSLLAALRRLARLRPTLLVIEDVHLLAGGGLAGVVELLNGLADEQIVLLCAARPIELPIRGVLERFLAEEIELEGLSRAELTRLLGTILESDPASDLIDPLLAATAGNPLALRSALRGAIKSGALARSGGSWRIGIPTAGFQERLERNVSLLSEGMAAHLNDAERRAAERIAALGEVVARETIDGIAGDEGTLVEALVFKGIIATSPSSIAPLPGDASKVPLLAFTHSLLHRRFVEHAEVDVDRLVRIIASRAPLYSILPFQLLAGRAASIAEPLETIIAALDRTLRAAQTLDSTADWRVGFSMWEIGAELFEVLAPRLDERRRRELELQLLNRRLMLLRREDTSEEYQRLVDRLLEVTASPESAGDAERRVQALTHLYRRLVRTEHRAWFHAIWEEVASLRERFPEVGRAVVYFEYIRDVAHAANMMSDRSVGARVEEQLGAIVSDPALDDEGRVLIRRLVYPHLLRSFDTKEELERRIAMLRELESAREISDIEFLWQACLFETSVGAIASAMPRFEITLPRLKERGLLYSYSHAIVQRLLCRAALGMPLEQMLHDALGAIPEAPEPITRNFHLLAAGRLGLAGALRGDAAWTESLLDRFLPNERDRLDRPFRLGLALACDLGLEAIRELAEHDDAEPDELQRTAHAILAADADRAACAERIARELARPILRVDDLLMRRGMIDLALLADREHRWDLERELRAPVRDMLERTLDWLDERAMYWFMTPLLSRYERFFTRQELAARRAAIADATRQTHSSREEEERETKIHLTMLGTIELHRPGAEPQRPRGARLRTLLGLLVADRMLEKPLAHRELCRLAASDASEIEDARKTLNLAVYRLREMLGHEAVMTDRETPRLNLDLVRVDLLEAHRFLLDAAEALRSATYHRAVAPLLQALAIATGDVPFPGLYEEFFEAAREDFENRLRLAAIRTAKGLLHEGDAMNAEAILRRCFEAMPDDEEIAELLCVALVQLGKRIEAQRVRLRVASEMEG